MERSCIMKTNLFLGRSHIRVCPATTNIHFYNVNVKFLISKTQITFNSVKYVYFFTIHLRHIKRLHNV